MHRKHTPTNIRETVPGLCGEESDDQTRPERDYAALLDEMEETRGKKVLPWDYQDGSRPENGPGVIGGRWNRTLNRR